jgi:hypothetical protein
MKLPLIHKNQILVRKFDNIENNSPITLLTFDGKIRNRIIEQFKLNYLTTGSHVQNGGNASPKSILTLIGAATGSVGLAGVASSQLFMATANPATLMTIGNGVGSAVMGSSGIVAQAPFIAVSGALMPVVAPLIAFQMISTITILNEFKAVNKKLDEIKSLIERNIQRDEATNLGIIISAFNRVEDIENEYLQLKHFNFDMINRLSLLENSVNPLFERYNYLNSSAESIILKEDINHSAFWDIVLSNILPLNSLLYMMNRQQTKTTINKDDAKYKRMDSYFTVLTSILDIRVSMLRVKLNMQEAPEYVETSITKFSGKVNLYKDLWQVVQKNYNEFIDISNQMSETIDSMNWWQKNLPAGFGGKRKERIESEKNRKILKLDVDFYDNNLSKVLDSVEKDIESSDKGIFQDLIYWRDETGEHSYYTNELCLI